MVKTKRERFEIIAGNRVQQIIDKLYLLGNCSNRNNYEFHPEDIKKMFSAIREALNRTEGKFDLEISKQGKKKFQF